MSAETLRHYNLVMEDPPIEFFDRGEEPETCAACLCFVYSWYHGIWGGIPGILACFAGIGLSGYRYSKTQHGRELKAEARQKLRPVMNKRKSMAPRKPLSSPAKMTSTSSTSVSSLLWPEDRQYIRKPGNW